MMVRFPSIDEYPAAEEDADAQNPAGSWVRRGSEGAEDERSASMAQRHRGRIRGALRHIHVEPAMFLLSLSYGLNAPTKQALIYR